jgi:TrmH family RNA methyltransferase
LVARSGDSAVLVTPELLSQLAYGGNPREAVAVFDRPEGQTLDRLALKPNPLVIVMVGIEKPGNAGAIFRSADAVGADAVVLCGGGCDLFNPNLIRGSLGTVFTMPCVESDEAQTVSWVRRSGLSCMAAIVGATQTFWEVDYRGPTAIVVGSEAQGLGPLWRNWDTGSAGSSETGGGMTAVSIPMLGVADSLNVSVSAAALLFEARRQRLLRET